nr:MAG TPA_asm: hypothetical protein [Bacteriophage sp.]
MFSIFRILILYSSVLAFIVCRIKYIYCRNDKC